MMRIQTGISNQHVQEWLQVRILPWTQKLRTTRIVGYQRLRQCDQSCCVE